MEPEKETESLIILDEREPAEYPFIALGQGFVKFIFMDESCIHYNADEIFCIETYRDEE